MRIQLRLILVQGVCVYWREIPIKFCSQKISNSTWSKACYYRLLLPDLLPNYDTVIYSDVDIIFQSSLSDAYHPIDDYYVAACQDVNTSHRKKRIRVLGLTSDQFYFCAGFMIMNLKMDKLILHLNRKIKLLQEILNKLPYIM